MAGLKCSVIVKAGVVPGESTLSRQWDFTEEDMNNPPTYIDRTGSAMNYAMSLQNPDKFNWVTLEWIWY